MAAISSSIHSAMGFGAFIDRDSSKPRKRQASSSRPSPTPLFSEETPMKPKQSDLPFLIGTCPLHQAIIKACGYGKQPCKTILEALKPILARHGQPKVDQVART